MEKFSRRKNLIFVVPGGRNNYQYKATTINTKIQTSSSTNSYQIQNKTAADKDRILLTLSHKTTRALVAHPTPNTEVSLEEKRKGNLGKTNY